MKIFALLILCLSFMPADLFAQTVMPGEPIEDVEVLYIPPPEITWKDLEPLDSFTFMKDDGEFSDEEKDKEAFHIYATCQSHGIRSIYYDCTCIAGAFRAARDAEDLVPQAQIVNSLYRDRDTKCVNMEQIAGSAYQQCQEYASVYRDRESEKRNEDYCQCVANRLSNNFSLNPRLDIDFISDLRVAAMMECDRPGRQAN
jgi:hypothetical protein